MRVTVLLVLMLAGCSSAEPAADSSVASVAPSPMSGYALSPHVRAYDASVTEGDATVAVRITLSPRSTRPVVVDYITEDGSARESLDYVRGEGRLTFKAGITEQTIDVGIVDDDLAEPEETFAIRLHVAEAAVLDTESVTRSP
jgi:hypothetical protein